MDRTLQIPQKHSNLLELINKGSKFAGYKIVSQKAGVFLYTKSQHPGEEIRSRVPFTRATKRIKYVEINLTKEVKGLYTENNETLPKET